MQINLADFGRVLDFGRAQLGILARAVALFRQGNGQVGNLVHLSSAVQFPDRERHRRKASCPQAHRAHYSACEKRRDSHFAGKDDAHY